jgi:uncharacterized protein YycO
MIWPSTLFAEEVKSENSTEKSNVVSQEVLINDAKFSEKIAAAEELIATGKSVEQFTKKELAILQEPANTVFGDEGALSTVQNEIERKGLAKNHYELATGNVEDSKNYQKDDNFSTMATEVDTMAAGVGTYPTRKGTILVTGDPAFGLIPTGHAAIVYAGDGPYGLIESLADGVQYGRNDWNTKKITCYGLDVISTSNAQERTAAEWCAQQIGKPYNWDYWNTTTRVRFYCSQLVWAAFKDNFSVDLNMSSFGNAVHPLELAASDKTVMFYSQGIIQAGWTYVDGSWFYLGQYGIPLTGWQWLWDTNGSRYWFWFEADGRMATNSWHADSTSYGYVGSNGRAYAGGWYAISGYWYFFNATGSRLESTWVSPSLS